MIYVIFGLAGLGATVWGGRWVGRYNCLNGISIARRSLSGFSIAVTIRSLDPSLFTQLILFSRLRDWLSRSLSIRLIVRSGESRPGGRSYKRGGAQKISIAVAICSVDLS